MTDNIDCAAFPIIPGTHACSSINCVAPLSICNLPTRYPKQLAEATLQQAYTFKYNPDFMDAKTIEPVIYDLSWDAEEIPAYEVCNLEKQGAISYYSYINPILAQEAKADRETKWVLDYQDRSCSAESAGITKGPAYISLFNSIQEILVPPTVATGIIPGMRSVGTRIPKPKGECAGTWDLKYVDGRLTWVCDEEDADILCEALTITDVKIILFDDTPTDQTITASVVNSQPAPLVEVFWQYVGKNFPATGIQLKLTASAVDPNKKSLVSVNWLNSASTVMSGTIGPRRADVPADGTGDGDYTPIITGSSVFQFEWSAVECYDKLASSSTYGDTNVICTVSVPGCSNAIVGGTLLPEAKGSIKVTCDPASTSGLDIENMWLTDENGNLYGGDAIGKMCNERRSGTFYINVEYINPDSLVFIGDRSRQAIEIPEELKSWVTVYPSVQPEKVMPMEILHQAYRVSFELPEEECGGSIPFAITSTTSGEVYDVTINKDCITCPTFVISSVQLEDYYSGENIGAWNIQCDEAATRRVRCLVNITPSIKGASYRNTDDDKISLSENSDSGIEINFIGSTSDKVVKVPDIAADSSGVISFVYDVIATTDLDTSDSPSSPAGSVTFTVEPSTEASSASEQLDIYKTCGKLEVSGEASIWRRQGAQAQIIGAPIKDCLPNVSYELGLGLLLRNTSAASRFAHTVLIVYNVQCTEGLTAAVNELSQERHIVLNPGEAVMDYSPGFIVATGDKKISGKVTITANLPEYGITKSASIDINPDCPDAPSGPCDSGTDPNCCPYVESADENAVIIGKNPTTGRCTIDLTSKVKSHPTYNEGNGISINPTSRAISVRTLASNSGLVAGSSGLYVNVDTESGITIKNNKLTLVSGSGSGVTYTAGTGISISNAGEISVNISALKSSIEDIISSWMAARTTQCN